MDKSFPLQQPVGRRAARTGLPVPQDRRVLLRQAPRRYRTEMLPVVGHQGAFRGAAEGMRLLQYRVEHRSEVAGRRIDDLQYLGGRGLPGERLLEFGTARIELPAKLGNLPFEIGHPATGRRGHANATPISAKPISYLWRNLFNRLGPARAPRR